MKITPEIIIWKKIISLKLIDNFKIYILIFQAHVIIIPKFRIYKKNKIWLTFADPQKSASHLAPTAATPTVLTTIDAHHHQYQANYQAYWSQV